MGKTLEEIAEERGADPMDAFLDLLVEEGGDVNGVFFSMCDDDMETALAHPLACIGTDGLAFAPEGPAHIGNPHPRCYGTYPRLLGHFVRERKLLTMEEAVRKGTSAPAARMGLDDRGLIAEGRRADLVVFDAEHIIDTATFTEPHQFPRGIDYVIVGGQVAVHDRMQSAERHGGVLRA